MKPQASALVMGNWKMNLTRDRACDLATAVAAEVGGIDGVRCVLVPSPVHVSEVGKRIAGSTVELGAQDCAAEDPGAYTGATSVEQLVDLGVRWVLVGHSERRHHFGETDELVAAKFAAVLRGGLIPVLCVGEKLEERDSGQTAARVGAQIDAALGPREPGRTVIAYEPVWAIGTGRNARLDDVVEVHGLIRERVGELWGPDASAGLDILYGGSVDEANAADYLAHEAVDGALVGGASLDSGRFAGILRAGAGRPI